MSGATHCVSWRSSASYSCAAARGSVARTSWLPCARTCSGRLRAARAGEEQGLIYSRINNPDLEILEDRLTLWDESEAACVFVSGMAAPEVMRPLASKVTGTPAISQWPEGVSLPADRSMP